MGPFSVGKKFTAGQAASTCLGFLPVNEGGVTRAHEAVDRWQATWSDLPVKARVRMAAYGFLQTDCTFRKKVAEASATDNLESPVVEAYTAGDRQAPLPTSSVRCLGRASLS